MFAAPASRPRYWQSPDAGAATQARCTTGIRVVIAVSIAVLALPSTWHGVTDHRLPGGIATLPAVVALPVGVGALLAWSGRRHQIVPYLAVATVIFTAANSFDVLRHQGEDPVPWGAIVLVNLIVCAVVVAVLVAVGYVIGSLGRRVVHGRRDQRAVG